MTLEQWTAIQNRDESYDGKFFYGIRTTGTVCRPSCNKKRCSPENVIIFDSIEEAEKQGFRPCKRCRPEIPGWKGARAELAAEAARVIEENYMTDFSLEKLADELHINKFYLLRTFRDINGETPLVYHNQVRCRKAEEMLTRPELSMAYISGQVGYNSASHFSRVFRKTTGITPTQYRKEYFRKLKENRTEEQKND